MRGKNLFTSNVGFDTLSRLDSSEKNPKERKNLSLPLPGQGQRLCESSREPAGDKKDQMGCVSVHVCVSTAMVVQNPGSVGVRYSEEPALCISFSFQCSWGIQDRFQFWQSGMYCNSYLSIRLCLEQANFSRGPDAFFLLPET